MKGMLAAAITIGTTFCIAPGGLWAQDVHGHANQIGLPVEGGGDTTPPAKPVLTLSELNLTTCHVAWTAVGDDNNSGTANKYELRYRVGTSFAQSEWTDAATVVVSPMPAPVTAGQAMSVDVPVAANGTYTFLMKVSDEIPNVAWSDPATISFDSIPPAQVTGFIDTVTSPNAVSLAWAASGDDGSTGSASSYTVYYSRKVFAVGEETAMIADLETTPVNVGNALTTLLNTLEDSTTYRFTIVAFDEKPNPSAPAPIITASTPAYVSNDAPSPLGGVCQPHAASGTMGFVLAGLAAMALVLRK